LVVEFYREMAESDLSVDAVRQPIQLAEA